MATLDEVLAAMPDEAEDVHEYLIIDAAARQILVPEAEAIFGVEEDRNAERKFFRCPRYVGDDLDLADMHLTVYFRNANGDEDGYLVNSVTIYGDYITFSWLLSEKVTAFPGEIQFSVCAARSKDGTDPDWNTTLASGTVLEGLHADPGDVEEQTSDVVTQLREEIKSSTAAVEAVGAAQIDAVEAAGANATQAAKDAVAAQGEATLATIPEDYTALAGTVDKLTRGRAAAIVCQAEGTAIQVNDASADPLVGLRIFGRSTQNGTPTPDAPVDIVSAPAPVVTVCGKNLVPPTADTFTGQGITSSPATTGTVTLNGTATAEMSRVVSKGIILAPGQYTLSVKGLNNKDTNHDRVFMTGSNGAVLVNYVMTGKPATFTLAEATTAQVAIVFASGSTYSNATAAVQLELGDVATEYEPYKGQTLTVTTPNGLPGIPVASGGNYTDANGQQWIADEVDLARGVYVQRILRKTLSNFSKAIATEPTNGHTEGYINNGDHSREKTGGLCDRFPYAASGHFERFGLAGAMVYFTLNGELTADEWRERMTALSPTIFVALKDPLEHALTEAELLAFRALHSVKPTTTVLNDAGAHMTLEYAADPKTYIDNKLAALVAGN